MQYLFTPPNKRRSFCGAQIRTLHRKKTGHTFFVCPTSKVLASQCLNLMTLSEDPLPFFESKLQKEGIEWIFVGDINIPYLERQDKFLCDTLEVEIV